MIDIKAQKNDGNVLIISSKFWVGDIVKIECPGYYYPNHITAFNYFWGTTKSLHKLDELYDREGQSWKIINIALNTTFTSELIYHIRNLQGENIVIGEGGLKMLIPNKNKPTSQVTVFQVNEIKHSWKEKLYKLN